MASHRDRKEWNANEEIDNTDLNDFPSGLLYVNTLTSDATVTGDGNEHIVFDGTNVLQTTLTVGSARAFRVSCSGSVDTSANGAHCTLFFNVAPANSPGTFGRLATAFNVLGFMDADGTSHRTTEWHSASALYIATLSGQVGFQMTAQQFGSTGTPLVKSGFQFWVEDLGSAI